MSLLLALLILFLFCAAVLGGVVGLVSRLAGRSIPKISATQVFAVLPYSKKKYFFSVAERSFYEVLKRLISPDYTLFAKVRLADLVDVTKGASAWQSHFNRISGKHVDFVLCDRDLAPVVAIELDDASHDEGDRQDRDKFVDQALTAAALPIVRIRAKRAYAPDQVRVALRPYLPAQSPAQIAHPDDRYMPPAGWRPAV
jgi:hypothetical protein